MSIRSFSRFNKSYARPLFKAGKFMSRWGFRGAKNLGRMGGKAVSMASAALRGLNKVRGLVNAEMYKFDSSIAVNIADTGTVQPLTQIPQGDGDNQRTGNSIFCRAWNLKGLLGRTTAGDSVQQVRLSVVMDTQQIGDTAPSITDIYESSSPYAHLNSNTVGRFKVLYSKNFILDAASGLGKNVNINIPMRHHVRYNGTSQSDIQKGGLYLVFSSTQTTSDYPTLTGEYRLSYHDN